MAVRVRGESGLGDEPFDEGGPVLDALEDRRQARATAAQVALAALLAASPVMLPIPGTGTLGSWSGVTGFPSGMLCVAYTLPGNEWRSAPGEATVRCRY